MNRQKNYHISALHHAGAEHHLLRAVMRVSQAIMNSFPRSVGISASQFMLLRLIAIAEQRVGTMDLARQLGVNAAAVTRLVKELEREGIVLRSSDPQDGRRSYVTLSKKGMKRIEELHERSHELERGFSSAIGPDEMAKTVEILERLRGVIEDQTRGSL